MKIINRIKRLETATGAGGFCLCYGKPEHPCTADFTGGKYEIKPLPEFCEKCGKQIDKSAVKISFADWQTRADARNRQAAETMAKFEN